MSMPIAIIDGIATRYEVVGSGPPLLMYSTQRWTNGARKESTPRSTCSIIYRTNTPALCSTVANVASQAGASNA
jgi:hypothetical protein